MRFTLAGGLLLVLAAASASDGGQLDWVLGGLDALAGELQEGLNASEGVNVSDLVRTRVSNYVSLVQRTLGLDAVGGRRQLRLKRDLPLKDPHGVYLLKYVNERFNIPAKFPNDIVLFSRMRAGVEGWFAVALETDLPHPELQMANHIVLYKLMEGRFLEQWRGPVAAGAALAVQEMGGWTYVAVAEQRADLRDRPGRGSRLYRLAEDGRRLDGAQTLQTPAPSDFCSWEFQGSYFLGVATEFSNETGKATFSADSLVYKWLGEHLDIAYRLPTTGAKAITAFSIESQHFIAVANHINDQGQTSIDSLVFRLSVEQGRYVVHQRVRTHGAVDVEFFSMQRPHGLDHFLVVANSFYQAVDGTRNYDTSSVVYKWTEGFFVPFQSFQLPAARQWSSYSGPHGELVLFAASAYGLHAFQYDGWRFQEVPLKGKGNFVSNGAGIVRLRSLNFGTEALLVVASKHNSGSTASVLALALERRAPLDERYAAAQLWCSAALGSVRSDGALRQLERVRAAPKFDSPEVLVNGTVSFVSNSSIMRVNTDTVKTASIVQDNSYRDEVNALNLRVDEQQRLLSEVRSVLDRSLKKTAVNSVPGRVVLEQAAVLCAGACVFPRATVGHLNGASVDHLVRNVIRLDENVHLPGEVRFSKVMMSELNVSRVLDLDAPLVSRADTRALSSSLVVRGLETSAALQVDGLVDTVRIHREHVLLQTGDQEFSAPARSVVWEVDRMDFRGRLGGMRLDLHVPALPPEVLHPWPNTIPDSLTVRSLKLEGLLGGVSLADVATRALRTKGPQFVTGAHQFSSLAARGVQTPSLNEIAIDKDVIRTDLIQEVIPGRLNFGQPLLARHVQVYRSLGSIAVATDGTLDLLLANSPVQQEVVGSKRLRMLDVTGQGRLHGQVLGLVLPASEEPLLEVVHEDIVIDGDVEISGAVRLTGSLRAEDLLDHSGRSLLKALSSSVRIDSGVLPAAVIDDLEVTNLRTEIVNGVPFKTWIPDVPNAKVHLRAPTNLLGNLAVVGGSNLLGKVNNVDLTALNEQALKQHGDQIITGFKSFDSISVNGAWSNNTIVNSVRWSDIWAEYSRDVVEISGNVILDSPLYASHISVAGKVNKMELTTMLHDSVFSDGGHHEVHGSKTFLQAVDVRNLEVHKQISGSGDVVLRLLGQEDVDEVTYTGNVNMQKPLSVKHLNYQGTLNGVKDSDWSSAWLEVDGDQTLYGKQTFLGAVQAKGGVNVTELNGVPVRRWAEQLVRLDDPNVRLGKVQFEAPVFANGPVFTGALLGVNLSDALLSSSLGGPQVVTAPVVLGGGLQVERSLLLEGQLAGVNIRDVCAFANPAPGAWSDSHHLLVEGNLFLDEEMAVNHVNGQSMKKLLNNSWLRDRPVYISAEMTFKDLNLTGEVKVEDRIDGVSLSELSERYISLSGDQTILTPMRFKDGIIVESDLLSSGPVHVEGRVNGENLKDFEDKVLRDGPDQTVYAAMEFGLLHVASNFTLNGLVNGMDLQQDVVRLDREVNVVKEKKSVRGHVWIEELEVEEGARVQGVDLAAWNREAVRLQGDQRVSGAKTFTEPRFSNDIRVIGTVNGILVDDEHLLLRRGDQVVRAAKTLEPRSGLVQVEALELDGQVNTVNMRELLANQAFRTGDVLVLSPVQWRAPLLADSGLVEKSYHGVNVSALVDAALHPPSLDEYQMQHESLLRAAERVQHSLRAQGYYLNYYHWAVSLHGALAVLPLGMAEDPAAAIAVVRRFAPGAPLRVEFFRWDADNSQLTPHPSVEPVSLPPTVRLVSAARWAGQSALYWEADESGTPGVGLHQGYVMGLLRDGRLGLAQLVRETQPSTWVHVAELGSRACLVRGSGSVCTLHCFAGTGQGDRELMLTVPAANPVHAVTLSVRGTPQLLIANAVTNNYEGGVDVWRFEADGSLRPVQTLGVVNATALAAIKYRGVHYLAIASGRTEDTPHTGMVHVSRYDEQGNWTHWLSLAVESPIRLQFAALPSGELALYVSADCPDQSLHVFLYRGVAGFVHKSVLAVPASAAAPLSAFTTAQHQHLVTTTDGGHAGLLHAVFKGSWEVSERAYRSSK